MGNLVPLFSGSRAERKQAHRDAGMNPDHGLLLPDDRTETQIVNDERRSLFRAAIRAAERGLAAEESYRDGLRSGLSAEHLAAFRREAEKYRAEAAWSLSLLDTPTLRGGDAA